MAVEFEEVEGDGDAGDGEDEAEGEEDGSLTRSAGSAASTPVWIDAAWRHECHVA